MALAPVTIPAAPDGAPLLASMPDLMTSQMLADELPDMSVRTLEDWRYRRIGPDYISNPETRRVYYLKADVLRWLTSNRHTTDN